MRGMARGYAAGDSRGPGWREFAGNVGSVTGWPWTSWPRTLRRHDLPPIFVPPAMLVQQGQGVEQQAAQSPGPAAYSPASCEA